MKNSYECGKMEQKINSKLNEINNILLNIKVKGNAEKLLRSTEELNKIYNSFKSKFGDIMNLDYNTLSILKNLLLQVKFDKKIEKELYILTIDLDPENVQ